MIGVGARVRVSARLLPGLGTMPKVGELGTVEETTEGGSLVILLDNGRRAMLAPFKVDLVPGRARPGVIPRDVLMAAFLMCAACGSSAIATRPPPPTDAAAPDPCGALCASLADDGCLPFDVDEEACLGLCAGGAFDASAACILARGGARCAMHCCNLAENDAPGACRDSSACAAGMKCSALARVDQDGGACALVNGAGTCACVSVETACYNP